MGELDEIRRKYGAGEYNSLMEDLCKFVRQNAPEIWAFGRQLAANLKVRLDQLTPEQILKSYVENKGTIESYYEINWQRHQIEAEKWIRGVNTGKSPDPNEVAQDWAKNYGGPCRRHLANVLDFLVTELFKQDKNTLLPEEPPCEGKV